MTDPSTVDAVATLLADATRVVVLTGAGVSTASGIPDFRGPQGRWTRDPEAERRSTIEAYRTDPAVRSAVWRELLTASEAGIRPNPAHHALAELERLGRVDRLVTQNVDGLHQDAGSAPDRVIEIHGTVREARCLGCRWQGDVGPVLERVRAGDDDPRCSCGGLLKHATISFGESLDPVQLQRAHDAAVRGDVLLTAGTSLVVHPVAMLPQVALDAGARLVVCNGEATGYDEAAHRVARGDVSELLPRIVERVRDRVRRGGADEA